MNDPAMDQWRAICARKEAIETLIKALYANTPNTILFGSDCVEEPLKSDWEAASKAWRDFEIHDHEWRLFVPAYPYHKDFYDVRTSDDGPVYRCWPNAGTMNTADGSGLSFGHCECEVRLSADSFRSAT